MSFFIFSGAPYSLPWALFTAALAAVGTMYVLNFWRGSMTDPFVLAGGGVALVGFTVALNAASLGWVWALILSMLITGVVGVLLDRIAYRPLRGAPRISLLITAIAMSFFSAKLRALSLYARANAVSSRHLLDGLLAL